uniref:Myosin light chain 5 n=1 Tax=Canis lupus familiaris TaxID=9615 RepID=A0A8C0LVD3_CANLF
MASRKTKKKEGGGLRAQRASSNVFSNFEQTQIQEFKEAFTLMDQNRDGFIDKEDLKDTYASLGKTNVKDEELDAMLKEASGPINFTMFLNMFGAKLTGTDGEETILNAFKMLDPDGKGSINKDYIKRLLMSQADKMTAEEVWPTLPHPTSFPMVLRGLGGRGAWPGDVPGPPEAAAWGGQGAAPRLTPPTSKNHTGAGWSSVPVIRWPPRPFPSSSGPDPHPHRPAGGPDVPVCHHRCCGQPGLQGAELRAHPRGGEGGVRGVSPIAPQAAARSINMNPQICLPVSAGEGVLLGVRAFAQDWESLEGKGPLGAGGSARTCGGPPPAAPAPPAAPPSPA